MAGCGRCRPRRRAAGNQPRRAPPDQLLPSQGTTNQSAPSTPWIYPKLERVPEPNSPPRCARRQHCPWAARGPAASSVAAAAAAAAPAPPRTPAPRDPAVDGPRDRHPRGGSCRAAEAEAEDLRREARSAEEAARFWPGRSVSRRRSCRAWRRAASPLLAVGALAPQLSGTAAAAAVPPSPSPTAASHPPPAPPRRRRGVSRVWGDRAGRGRGRRGEETRKG